MRLLRFTAAITLGILVFPGTNYAFHDGGVANCSGCHVMHGEQEGVVILPGGQPQLLNNSSASGVCLSCHADQTGAVMGQDPLMPPVEFGGGKFVFLYEDNINDAVGGADNPIGGHAAGHSIVAPSIGLNPDPLYTTAPGGSFPSNQLSCTSCHDPHGNQNFRMLRGIGPVSAPGGGPPYNFTYPAPVAVGIDLDSRNPETRNHHTAYISGVSEWCSNCHGRYHDQVGQQNFQHSFNQHFESSQINRYNSYNGVQDSTGGSAAMSYIAEVPFQDPTSTIDRTSGPSSASVVVCLTCHRAHATSSPEAGRWDFRTPFLDRDGLESGSYPIPSPYPGTNQPRLCTKCHSVVPNAAQR